MINGLVVLRPADSCWRGPLEGFQPSSLLRTIKGGAPAPLEAGGGELVEEGRPTVPGDEPLPDYSPSMPPSPPAEQRPMP